MRAAFYKGRKRLFNRVTAWWLRGPYSHCELIVGADMHGRSICASSSMLDGGVRIKAMHLDPEHWDLVDVGGDAAAAWAWAAAHDGDGYDILGLLGFIARALRQSKRRWFCSEAVGEMLGMPDPWRFDPCSLWAALRRRTPPDPQPATSAGFFMGTQNNNDE